MTMAIHADDLGAATSTRLSFVRHAQSESNVANEIRGERTCTGLTTLGHEQANCLARRIELDHDDDPITQVYSTPLRRAVDTATPVARILGLGIRYLPSWRYATYGAAEGRSWREAYEEFPGIHPALHPDLPIAEGAETMRAFHESMRTAIVELVRRHPGEHSLVFGSTENLMAVEEIMLGLPPDARSRSKLAVDHTGIMTWDLVPAPWSPAGRRTVLVRHNDSGHLPAEQRHSRFRAIPVLGT